MAYRYLEDIATSDAAFEAIGADLEELFVSAADATTNVMVEDLGSVKNAREMCLEFKNTELDMLLFEFLGELVYMKDAFRLLLRATSADVRQTDAGYVLRAVMYGEEFRPGSHRLNVDVKAVTMYRLDLGRADGGWRATVVLDI